jgi:hypothetical protein
MIVGICGLIGSGKGTVADYLVQEHGFVKLSFADKLKDAVSTMFGWDRKMLEGDTDESRKWREQPDEFWSKETGKQVTPRLVLQLFGTDCMRNGFYDGVWVSLVKQQIVNSPDTNFVIPDTRFQNEIQMVTDVGGQVWWVRRGPKPDWWGTAVAINHSGTPTSNHSMRVVFPEVHESEWRWAMPDTYFDEIIENNASVEQLQKQIKNLLFVDLLPT